MATVIVGIIVLVIVSAAARKVILDRIKNKSSCGCSCSGCPGACHQKPE